MKRDRKEDPYSELGNQSVARQGRNQEEMGISRAKLAQLKNQSNSGPGLGSLCVLGARNSWSSENLCKPRKFSRFVGCGESANRIAPMRNITRRNLCR